MKKDKKNIFFLFLIFTIVILFSNKRTVMAEETYTCSAKNISNFYCSFLTESRKAQYGCTITKTSSGCSGTCNNLTKSDIDQF